MKYLKPRGGHHAILALPLLAPVFDTALGADFFLDAFPVARFAFFSALGFFFPAALLFGFAGAVAGAE